MKSINSFRITIPAKSINEGFSRSLISCFASMLDPTIEELSDLKTAVSEAVTNCIVHAYKNTANESKKIIRISAQYDSNNIITVKIKDIGCGIADIQKALTPLYTEGDKEERSGMGFSIMQCFCDKMTVKSAVGKGTTVTLKKYISKQDEN